MACDSLKSIIFNFVFLSLGWFGADVSIRSSPFNSGFTFSTSCDSNNQCDDDIFHNGAEVDQKIRKIENSFYRTYPYRPNNVNDDVTRRWRLLTNKYNYEMINQEPRIGLNGMWRAELEQVDQYSRSIILKSNMGKDVELVDILRHHDPYQGVQYIINYKNKATSDEKIIHTVELERNYFRGKPVLKEIIGHGGGDVINIIMPLSKVTDRFMRFLRRLETSILNRNPRGVRFIFVIFQTEDDVSNDDVTIRTVKNFHDRNSQVDVRYKKLIGEFNRARGLDAGVQLVQEDEIMLFLDVDLTISEEFCNRIRLNVQRNKRVLFPIVFSQYDPGVGKKAALLYPPLKQEIKVLNENSTPINKNTGFWLHYAYGIVAIYKSDYINAGGLKTDIEGWGGEDVDFFKRVVAMKSNIEVMSSVDPHMVHIYHPRNCDVTLPDDQYMMCIGAWSETLASQLEAGLLYNHGKTDV